MKVFISWSGDISKRIALALRDWLPYIIHAIDPWVSEEDIDKGARWIPDIAKQLEEVKVGIFCITPQNFNSPWLNFEAGAISKVVGDNHTCPYLFNMSATDLKGPLTQFQVTVAEKEDTKKLIYTLNKAQESKQMDSARLDNVFDKWWPDLEKKLADTNKIDQQEKPKREDREIFIEILELVRRISRETMPGHGLSFLRFGDLWNATKYKNKFSDYSTPKPIIISSKECPECGEKILLPAGEETVCFVEGEETKLVKYNKYTCSKCSTPLLLDESKSS